MQRPPQAPVLAGDGFLLRLPGPQDEAALIAQCQDPQMQRWTTIPVPYTVGHARQWLASRRRCWDDGTAYTLAIETAGRFRGNVELQVDGTAALSVGYGLTPEARGQGLMVKALRTALTWAFEAIDPDVVLWSALAGNWASRRVAWANGFRVEGTVRGLIEQRGRRLDGWVGSLRPGDPLDPPHPWFLPVTLPGRSVVLRPHAERDLAAMTEACNDPVTQHWLAQLPRPYTVDDARAHLEEIAEEQAAGRSQFWAIADTVTDQLIGEIGVWGIAQGHSRSGEIGYWSHPAARGRRLTTEGLRLVCRHALAETATGGLGLRRLVIRAATGNQASQRVALGAGFSPAGCDRDAERHRDGTGGDLLRYDLLRQDVR